MARYAMVTDLRKCVACHACAVSCGAEWGVPPGQARTRVSTTPITGTFPDLRSSPHVAQCNHCDRPSCLEPCPTGATWQDEGGVVRVDTDVCVGCGFCVPACPYDARFVSEATRKVDKCDFCAPRVARGREPACVTTCTAGAKTFGDLEDPASEVHRLVFHQGARRVESAEAALGPNVYYLGRPEDLDLVAASFAPHAPSLPAAAGAWSGWVKPLVLGVAGAAFAGQALAFFEQLRRGEEDHDD